jgi:hypothetical protein
MPCRKFELYFNPCSELSTLTRKCQELPGKLCFIAKPE